MPAMGSSTASKGFINIIEIVIIVGVVFLVMLQFTYIPKMSTDWSETKLVVKGSDLLYLLERVGTDWTNPDEIMGFLDDALTLGGMRNSTIIYDLRIKGAIKPEIRVGCICTDDEYKEVDTEVSDALKPFYLNGRNITFVVNQIPTGMGTPGPQFPHTYDVIIIMPEFFEPITHPAYTLDGYQTQISNYLGADKGILIVRNYTAADTTINRVDNRFFGVGWNETLVPSGNMSFTGVVSQPESPLYDVYNHFYNFPKESDGMKIEKPQYFANLLHANEKTLPSDITTAECALEDWSGLCGLILNRGMPNGYGRTAWLSRSEGITVLNETEENDILLKSIVAWLAGENNRVISNDMEGPVISRLYRLLTPAGLVGMWDFEHSGSIASDSSGNANHGIITGTFWVDGSSGKALEFDGEDDYIEINDSASLHTVGRAFTIEGWFNATNLSQPYSPIISKHVFSDPPGSQIYVSNISGMVRLASKWLFENGTECEANSTSPINDNQWYHFAYVYNSSHIMLYLNGNTDPDITVECGDGQALKSSGGNVRIGGI